MSTSHRLCGECGASAVEFALVVPLLVLLVLGIIEFGHGFQVQGTLSAAAREGVRTMALQNDQVVARAAVKSAASTLEPIPPTPRSRSPPRPARRRAGPRPSR